MRRMKKRKGEKGPNQTKKTKQKRMKDDSHCLREKRDRERKGEITRKIMREK